MATIVRRLRESTEPTETSVVESNIPQSATENIYIYICCEKTYAPVEERYIYIVRSCNHYIYIYIYISLPLVIIAQNNYIYIQCFLSFCVTNITRIFILRTNHAHIFSITVEHTVQK